MYFAFDTIHLDGSRTLKRFVVADLHLQSTSRGEPRLTCNLGI